MVKSCRRLHVMATHNEGRCTKWHLHDVILSTATWTWYTDCSCQYAIHKEFYSLLPRSKVLTTAMTTKDRRKKSLARQNPFSMRIFEIVGVSTTTEKKKIKIKMQMKKEAKHFKLAIYGKNLCTLGVYSDCGKLSKHLKADT